MTPAPVSIDHVVLTVHDLASVSRFYQRVIGLSVLASGPGYVRLGSAARTLVELREDRDARRWTAREAGLFHTAFLLPDRADLGRWLKMAVDQNIAVQGASDHIVSEAAYLADPEGNGIEIYVDRPASSWRWQDGVVTMATKQMDVQGVIKSAAGTSWTGVPDGTIVGHVHLQVGENAAAEAFYNGVLGLDITAHYPGATFYSSGGYHHHIATNTWNSRGAAVRQPPVTGLQTLVLAARADAIDTLAARSGINAQSGELALADPWGTQITVRRA